MKMTKKQVILRELEKGKQIHEISREFDITPAYVYKVKRLNKKSKQKLINVTSLVKTNKLNELSINGLSIKCSDKVLLKIFRGLTND